MLNKSLYIPKEKLSAHQVGKELIGKILVRNFQGKIYRYMILETEAYPGGNDKASHTYNGRSTLKNQSMWTNVGHFYVYFVYGMYFCLNFVVGDHKTGAAVLIRSIEPLDQESLEFALSNRVNKKKETLLNGPGKICQALLINKWQDGIYSSFDSDLYILNNKKSYPVTLHKRIGIDYAGKWKEKLWRYKKK